MENAVSIASLGVLGTVTGALIWFLKKLFTQNDTTLRENTMANKCLATSIDNLNETMKLNEASQKAFQAGVVASLSKISSVQDTIAERQVEMYKHIDTKIMNVQSMTVEKETIKRKG